MRSRPFLRLLSICFVFIFFACKKEEVQNRFVGVVRKGNSPTYLNGASVKAQKKDVNNGVFSSEYVLLGETQSSDQGNYEIPFEVGAFAALRLEFSKTGYHKLYREVPSNYFDQNDTYTFNTKLYSISEIEVHLSDGNKAFDEIHFRYPDANFDCNCCDAGWKIFNQPNIDTTWSCMVYGDQFVRYQYRWISDEIDSLVTDSIYCAPQAIQQINLQY
jgi:hypothetical protein